jgi:DNA-binding CsgD family transcriptional regulator
MAEAKELVKSLAKKVGTDEISLVQHFADDMRVQQVADEMGIGKRLVESRLTNLKSHFKVKTTAGLVVMFIRNGLIE